MNTLDIIKGKYDPVTLTGYCRIRCYYRINININTFILYKNLR